MVRTFPFHGKNMSSILIESISVSNFYKNIIYNVVKIIMDISILKSFSPEIFLSMAILFQLVFNARFVINLKFYNPVIDREVFFQTFFIIVCLILLLINLKIEGFLSNFLFVNDHGGKLIKIFVVVSCLLILNILMKAFSLQTLNFFEFFTIFLLSLLSLLLLVSSSDLISFYLTIEMQALCFYILATFKRNSAFSTEAGLKYFISGSFISGIFLFGASLIYGCLGTLNLNNISLLLSFSFLDISKEFSLILLTGIIMVTSTLLFKVACAPFHFWSPDVYEGSPLVSTIIFSVVPKVSLFFFFIRWISSINILFVELNSVLLILGIFSTFVGTFFALNQIRLKKLIIYSSIAQVGFIVAGLSVNTLGGFSAVYFFLIIYILTSILIWGHFTMFYAFQDRINFFYSKESTVLFISSLSNFFKNNSLWALSFIIIFFSVAGIPPLTGFLSKILILYELVDCNKIIGAIALIIISSVSVYYYIRMIKVIFFEPKSVKKDIEKFQTVFLDFYSDGIHLVFAIALFILLISFFFPTGILLTCQYIVLNTLIF